MSEKIIAVSAGREITETEFNEFLSKLPEQQQEGTHAQQNHHQHGPAADHLVGTAGGVTFSAGIVWHGWVPPWNNRTGRKAPPSQKGVWMCRAALRHAEQAAGSEKMAFSLPAV